MGREHKELNWMDGEKEKSAEPLTMEMMKFRSENIKGNKMNSSSKL